ncbi:spore germination protein [Bacillus ectoiniformans]|uniref:Ger(x)C family spore germination protein n=1 Tax=Bacillus ectoiniformans TaxID=1494429 RepID=UPI001959E350|nr:Ger(x)C family spore germination protein [Bacillus ectoiniformans]MBM7647407.1 spore germination protein [Bacillus ectoiniformans]
MSKYGWIIFFIVLVTNYSIRPHILEDVQLVTAIGYDYVDKDLYQGTAASPAYFAGDNPKPETITFTATGHTTKDIKQSLQRESPAPLVIGRLNTILFNKKLAEKGLSSLIDSILREPHLGRDVFLVVADGQTKDILNQDYPVADTTTQYISDLIAENKEENIPKTNLHHFVAQYEGTGADPFLPILKSQGEHIRFTEIALFKDDRLVGTLPFKDSFIFKTILENFQNGTFEFRSSKGTFIAIENLSSKVKIKVRDGSDQPKATIHVTMQGKVTEASGLSLDRKKTIKSLEEDLKKEAERKAENMLKKFQKLNVDPVGLGEYARSQNRGFNEKEWQSKYPSIPITYKMDVQIIQTGIVE